MQRIIFYVFFSVAIAGILLTLPHVQPARLPPPVDVAPLAILSTTFLCFHAFVGWEHAAFSSEEMLDAKSLVKSVAASVAVVTVTFTLLAIAVVGAIDPRMLATSNTSLSDLLAISLGPNASTITAAVAMIIIFMMMLSWVRGGSRLLYSMARNGVMPGALARVDAKSSTPRRALFALALAWTVSLVIFDVMGLDVERYLRLANANYLMTYLLVFIAAVKLLWPQGRLVPSALVSLVAVVILLALGAADLWYPLLTAIVFLALRPLFGLAVRSGART